MSLSDRLKAVAAMITPGLRVADVGCDHGYLAIYLIRKNISPHVIAMDVGEGPLMRAVEHVREAGLTDRIETRLSDGLDKLAEDEAECVVMAGMGGRLMMKIMEDGGAVCSEIREFILQPQSEIEMVRHFLENNGYRIISEDMVFEDDKFYPMMKVIHGKMDLDKPVYYRYGRILIKEQHPVLRAYLRRERRNLLDIAEGLRQSGDSERVKIRLREISEDIAIVDEAIARSDKEHPVTIERVIK